MPRIVCVSDTHNKQLLQLPQGDILVHGGDFSMLGAHQEVASFVRWLKQQSHRLKIVIAGNHDVTLDNQSGWYDRHWDRFDRHGLGKQDTQRIRDLLTEVDLYPSYGIVYLENSGFRDPKTGLKFWGSPNQPEFCGWAFANEDRAAAARVWSLIPSDTDVLITHGPPAGVLDSNASGSSCGCAELTKALERVKPVLHVFGHIHEAYGLAQLTTGTLAVNACTCNLSYKPLQAPVVVDVDVKKSQQNANLRALLGDAGCESQFEVTKVTKCWV